MARSHMDLRSVTARPWEYIRLARGSGFVPLISESVTVNTTFSSPSCRASTGSVTRCGASRCRPSRRLRATKEQPGPITPTPLNFLTDVVVSTCLSILRSLIADHHIGPHSYGSFPLISSPSQRHEFVRPVCRIHPSSLTGFMRGSRLHRLRAALSQRRVYIVFLPAQDVKSRFRQVSSYRANRLGMAFALLEPPIQVTDVPFRPSLVVQSHDVGRFHKRPTQIAVDVRPQPAKTKFVPAGMDPRCRARIAGQMLGARKTAHLSNLEGDTGPENQSEPSQAFQALYLGGDFQQVAQAFLALADLFLQHVQLLEQLLTDPLGLFRQPRQQLRPLASGPRAEGIAAVPDRQSILGQGRLESVLQSSALSDQNQTRAGQFPLVAQLRRRNPHRGQGPVALKPVQAVDIQFVGFVDQTHHQLGFAGMHQLRFQSRLFNFADDPIPVAGGFNSDVGSALTVAQTSANRSRLMGDSELDRSCCLPVFSFH